MSLIDLVRLKMRSSLPSISLLFEEDMYLLAKFGLIMGRRNIL
jgi:hypothetical protein